MNNLSIILQTLKKNLTKKRDVDFEEYGLHFELRPVTNYEETLIMESIKDIDSASYIEALKKHSIACSINKMVVKNPETGELITHDFSQDIVEYEADDGNVKKKSKFLYLIDFLKECPTALIDVLFDAHVDLHTELDETVKKAAKFERFAVSEKIPENREEKIRTEPEKEEDLDEAEKLRKQVNQELEREEAKLAKG
jgi:hypothetical protein